jgi:hypothetical protein
MEILGQIDYACYIPVIKMIMKGCNLLIEKPIDFIKFAENSNSNL